MVATQQPVIYIVTNLTNYTLQFNTNTLYPGSFTTALTYSTQLQNLVALGLVSVVQTNAENFYVGVAGGNNVVLSLPVTNVNTTTGQIYPGGSTSPVSNGNTSSSSAPYQATALGYQQITSGSLTTAQPLPNIPSAATFALITVENVDCRWRDDGVAPTTTVGNYLAATGLPLTFSGDLTTFKIIATQAGTPGAVVNVNYYK